MELKLNKKLEDSWLNSFQDKNISISQYVIEQLQNGLISKLDSYFIEGLKRKGFEFKNKTETIDFIKENCRCEDNVDLKERVYFVNDIPFFLHKYDVNLEYPINETEREFTISASLGEYAYL